MGAFNKEWRVFAASFLVFFIINFFENLVHYSIGRNDNTTNYDIKLEIPSFVDGVKIFVIMVVFGVLQALGTCYFSGC